MIPTHTEWSSQRWDNGCAWVLAAYSRYYNYFRDYDASIGRYIESDPIGLNGGINTYGFVKATPLKGVDPYGLEAVFISFMGYGVGTPGGGSLPLGHAGVIAVDPATGETRYYDFGRYGGRCGDVRGPFSVGRILFDEKKNMTRESVELAVSVASHAYGKDSATYTWDSKKSFQDVIDYAERRKRQAMSCERPYNFLFDNCKNFANEAATP